MDKLLFKYLKSEIETFFIDFKEEDINANFFKGNMELANLRLNTDVIQGAMSTMIPYIEVVSATVQKLKIKVPFSNLKSKPTEVWISRIDVVLREPLDFLEFQNILKTKLETLKQKKQKTGKYDYTLFDRVMDGVQVTIDHIHVSFALLGKYKHARRGAWTPNIADINIYDLEVYSTNEKWERVNLKDTRAYTHGKPHVWHFKESTFKISIRLLPNKDITTVPMDLVTVIDRLPIKLRLTQQRLNMDEIVGMEIAVLVDDAKMSFTTKDIGHLLFWVDSLASAAFRKDLRKGGEEKKIVPETGPNVLLTIAVAKSTVELRTGKDNKPEGDITIELDQLQLNRIIQTGNISEIITRILLSQVTVKEKDNNTKLVQLLLQDSKPKDGSHLLLPIPQQVRIHPTPIPEPAVVRACALLTVRFPDPAPPTPSLEVKAKVDIVELVLERDCIENLGIFFLKGNLINAARPVPTEEDYKGANKEDDLDADFEKVKQSDGVEYLEQDLLSGIQLIGVDSLLSQVIVKIPTPGGGDLPYLQFSIKDVGLNGSPSSAPAVYKRDFLELKSRNGLPLVMEHDFYYQKFKLEQGKIENDHTFKINVQIGTVEIDLIEKLGATPEFLCQINNISSYLKMYSRARFIPNRVSIPQVESSVVAHEILVKLIQKQHHMFIDLLMEHFLYGASSPLKAMLEDEIRILAKEDKPSQTLIDPTKTKRFMILPTYMISAAVDKLNVRLVDNSGKDTLTLNVDSTEWIAEKHDDRQTVISRLGDIRFFSVYPEIENSLIWVKKKSLKNVAQVRTEWKKLNELNSLVKKNDNSLPISQSYCIGEVEGINVNLDLRNIYSIKDYLVDVLGETIVCIEKTQHSHFLWKITKYIEILMVTGIPSEANDYWNRLREAKLFLEQFIDIFLDITWDFSLTDFHLYLGDESIKLEPISIEKVRMNREQTNEKDTIKMNLSKVKGSIWTTEGDSLKENLLVIPIDTDCEITRIKNPDWNESSGPDVPKWLQNASLETNPRLQISLQPQHFGSILQFLERHLLRVRDIISELMDHADKNTQRKKQVIFDENTLNEARGMQARATSANAVSQLQKELAKAKKELEEALYVQQDMAQKQADLQVQKFDLEKKLKTVETRANGYEQAMTEMQNKLVSLQLQVAGIKQ